MYLKRTRAVLGLRGLNALLCVRVSFPETLISDQAIPPVALVPKDGGGGAQRKPLGKTTFPAEFWW